MSVIAACSSSMWRAVFHIDPAISFGVPCAHTRLHLLHLGGSYALGQLLPCWRTPLSDQLPRARHDEPLLTWNACAGQL